MFEIFGEFKVRISPEKLREQVRARLAMGGARAFDVILGRLRAYSTRDILHARSGNLAKSWSGAISEDTPGFLSWRSHNPMIYARILELGGVIKPVKGQYLAVPIPGGPASTAGGVSRFPGGPRTSGHPLFVLTSKAGNKFLAEHLGHGKLELWYSLKKQVKIPAFHYASKAVRDAKPAAQKEIQRALKV